MRVPLNQRRTFDHDAVHHILRLRVRLPDPPCVGVPRHPMHATGGGTNLSKAYDWKDAQGAARERPPTRSSVHVHRYVATMIPMASMASMVAMVAMVAMVVILAGSLTTPPSASVLRRCRCPLAGGLVRCLRRRAP